MGESYVAHFQRAKGAGATASGTVPGAPSANKVPRSTNRANPPSNHLPGPAPCTIPALFCSVGLLCCCNGPSSRPNGLDCCCNGPSSCHNGLDCCCNGPSNRPSGLDCCCKLSQNCTPHAQNSSPQPQNRTPHRHNSAPHPPWCSPPPVPRAVWKKNWKSFLKKIIKGMALEA